jgi:hypothetical protein
MSNKLKKFWDLLPSGWLMDGEPFVRYNALIGLLDRPKSDKEVVIVKGSIPADKRIRQILKKQTGTGYWGTSKDIYSWFPRKDTTFWMLGVLADFGLTKDNKHIAHAGEYVLTTQLENGGFGWAPPPTAADCFTGILTESLAKAGYGDDPRLQKAYSWLINRQRLDGGFWCKNTGLPGKPREKEPSCAFATLCTLGAFSQNPELKNSAIAEKCVEFLLKCWENRGKIKYAGHDSQVGTGWEKLKYPFTDYRILKYLDVLSQFESARSDRRMNEMLELLIAKHDENGRFCAESIHNVWSDFDFGQKKYPSRWITLLVYRIVKRIMQG